MSNLVITMSHEELNKFFPSPLLMETDYVIGTEGFYIKVLCQLMDYEAGSNLAEYILDKTACAKSHRHMHEEKIGGDPVSANSNGWLLASNLADEAELKDERNKKTAVALGRCWLRAVHEELHAPKK